MKIIVHKASEYNNNSSETTTTTTGQTSGPRFHVRRRQGQVRLHRRGRHGQIVAQ